VRFTAIDPSVLWDFLFFTDEVLDTSFIKNAVVEYAGSLNGWAVWLHDGRHALVIDSVLFRNLRRGTLIMQGAGTVTNLVARTRIENTVTDTTGVGLTHPGIIGANPLNFVDVEIINTRGFGIASSSLVNLNGVTITGSANHGIHVTLNPQQLTLSRVNLVGNAGFGINNVTAATVNAPGLWWGDPAGPNGPNGDGVSGPVTWVAPAGAAFTVNTHAPTPMLAASSSGPMPTLSAGAGLRMPILQRATHNPSRDAPSARAMSSSGVGTSQR
jgi:hypothetical protein